MNLKNKGFFFLFSLKGEIIIKDLEDRTSYFKLLFLTTERNP